MNDQLANRAVFITDVYCSQGGHDCDTVAFILRYYMPSLMTVGALANWKCSCGGVILASQDLEVVE
jgi:hypothetical protein